MEASAIDYAGVLGMKNEINISDTFRGSADFRDGRARKKGMPDDYYYGYDLDADAAKAREYEADQIADHFTDDLQRRYHDELRRPK